MKSHFKLKQKNGNSFKNRLGLLPGTYFLLLPLMAFFSYQDMGGLQITQSQSGVKPNSYISQGEKSESLFAASSSSGADTLLSYPRSESEINLSMYYCDGYMNMEGVYIIGKSCRIPAPLLIN